ncbi:hypothetical protein C5167_040503, partial [Papaver somniferum]
YFNSYQFNWISVHANFDSDNPQHHYQHQAKFAKSHQGEIQFARSVVTKILGSAGTDQLLHEPDASIPLIGLRIFSWTLRI